MTVTNYVPAASSISLTAAALKHFTKSLAGQTGKLFAEVLELAVAAVMLMYSILLTQPNQTI